MSRMRISAARRRIASIASSPLAPHISAMAMEERAFARIVVTQLRNCRDLDTLTKAAGQLEERAEALISALMAQADALSHTPDIAPPDAVHVTHSTTTSQHPSAKAEYSNSYPEKRGSGDYDVREQGPQTPAEEDLERYGITPTFLKNTAPEIFYSLAFQDPQWSDVVVLAERLAGQNAINLHTWREACRLMGQKAAAAAVIATVRKFRAGVVERPGAYLCGMSKRAASGALHLGRTLHGLKDMTIAASVATSHGDDPRSLGQIAHAALLRARVASAI